MCELIVTDIITFLSGVFYAASAPDESILGVTSDEDNKQLITGDTRGHVGVWDIENHCVEPKEKVSSFHTNL